MFFTQILDIFNIKNPLHEIHEHYSFASHVPGSASGWQTYHKFRDAKVSCDTCPHGCIPAMQHRGGRRLGGDSERESETEDTQIAISFASIENMDPSTGYTRDGKPSHKPGSGELRRKYQQELQRAREEQQRANAEVKRLQHELAQMFQDSQNTEMEELSGWEPEEKANEAPKTEAQKRKEAQNKLYMNRVAKQVSAEGAFTRPYVGRYAGPNVGPNMGPAGPFHEPNVGPVRPFQGYPAGPYGGPYGGPMAPLNARPPPIASSSFGTPLGSPMGSPMGSPKGRRRTRKRASRKSL